MVELPLHNFYKAIYIFVTTIVVYFLPIELGLLRTMEQKSLPISKSYPVESLIPRLFYRRTGIFQKGFNMFIHRERVNPSSVYFSLHEPRLDWRAKGLGITDYPMTWIAH